MTKFKVFTLTATTALTLAIASPLSAQSAPQAMQQGQQMQQINVDEQTMKQFVDVQKNVLTVQQKYSQQLEQAGDNQQATEAIVQQANQEMAQIVEQSPLSIEEYNQIAMLLPQDRKLQQQYQKHSK